jgi:aminopeptidase N
MTKRFTLFCWALLLSFVVFGQGAKQAFSRRDNLFGSNTPHRSWWNVQRYDVEVAPDFTSKTIAGRTTITFTVLPNRQSDYLQVDLQKPMQIDSLYFNGKIYINDPGRPYYNDGSHYFIPLPKLSVGSTNSVTVVYHGRPKEAVNAPWDGGWVWKRDKNGRPWMSVACESDGASIWYPCKDIWSDEPDKGASLTIHVPDTLMAIGNGRLLSKTASNGIAIYRWEVKSPINTYNIIPYIGQYTSWSDTLSGEKGKLDLTYWVLDYEKERARKQFEQVKPTLRSFEHWFGPYPFYEDGYQLVQSPYLGMEHQSAVAYGNGFKNGYMGTDLSGTGWGLKWDYIIVHETGHEWFGNNITAKDKADMWVHEGFTNYSESIFIETYWGKEAANEYTQGLRKNIQNDKPVIGSYDVHKAGSTDMYYKGANLVHTIRQLLNDDVRLRQILRGLNNEFYHQTVTTAQVENYISKQGGIDLTNVFYQYLRTTKIPVLEFRQTGNTIRYRWNNIIKGFNMPVKTATGLWLKPSAQWQVLTLKGGETFGVDKNFYINLRKL